MTEVAIRIPDELEPFIDDSVRGGAFRDVADFLVNLLYTARAQSEADLTEEQLSRLAALRTEIAIGIQQADGGDFAEFDAEEAIAEGRARLAARAAQ